MAVVNFLPVSGNLFMSHPRITLVLRAVLVKTYNTTQAIIKQRRRNFLFLAKSASSKNKQTQVKGNIRHNKTLDKTKYICAKLTICRFGYLENFVQPKKQTI